MQTYSLLNHPLSPTRASFSSKLGHPRTILNRNNRLFATMAFNNNNNNDGSGKMVDENMIVLRERIRKMKWIEGDHGLPENWMKWETTYVNSGGYYSDVFEVVKVLQGFLMDSRPSLALGLVVVFAVGGSTMGVVVLQCLMSLIHGN